MPDSPYPGVYRTGPHTWGYVVSERDPITGKRRQPRRGGFPTAEAARDERASHQLRITRGDITPATITVKQAVDDYIAMARLRGVKPSSLHAYRQREQLYISPMLGKRRLASLRAADVAEWLYRLQGDGRKPSVIVAAHGLLVGAINQALRDRLVDVNVASHVSPPRPQRKRPATWNDEQIRKFLAVADQHPYRAMWRLSLMLQMRPGEAAGLMWSDIDLRAGRLTIKRTRTRDETGHEVMGDSTKSDGSSSEMPLPADCIALLREHQQEQRRFRLAYPGAWDNGDLVFPSRQGRRLSSSTVNLWMHRLCDDAKIDYLSPHKLRHTGATWLLDRGESVAIISRRLRHASIRTTEMMYLGELHDAQEGVSARIDEAFRRASE